MSGEPKFSVEIDLSADGYARLCAIAENMVKRPGMAAFTLGDCVHLVLEAGTAAVEQRLKEAGPRILVPGQFH